MGLENIINFEKEHNNFESKINVTSPFLPSLDEYTKILSKAWENKWLTNSGELHKEFEKNNKFS